jgi:putative serine/threonine protein kinase
LAEVVSVSGLFESGHGQVLCYPRCPQEELENRLKELETLGVQAIEFTGDRTIFGVPVLGKGWVGIVVVAHLSNGKAALKIRRSDSGRESLFHESEMLKTANQNGVGPKLVNVTQNFLLMELIQGTKFPEWIQTLEDANAKPRLRHVIKQVLEQCYKLDQAGLDHGEISKAPKHILVTAQDTPVLIDFETSSIKRRVSNVTSVCQYLFLGSQIAPKVNSILGQVNENEFINVLRTYKQERSRTNFENVLEKIL